MNINRMIKKIKDQIGLSKFLKTSYDDKAIYDIIVNHALRDWAYYFKFEYDPGMVKLTDNLVRGNDLMAIPDYIINNIDKSGLLLEDIRDIQFRSNLYENLANNATLYAAYNSTLTAEQMYAGQASGQMMGDLDLFNYYRYSGWFEKPNSIRFNFPISMSNGNQIPEDMASRVKMSLYLSQPDNLCGISPTREHYFFELAKLHVMKVIYENEIKYMENISSGAGNINIKTEEWAQAGQAIKELSKQLESFSTLSQISSVTI